MRNRQLTLATLIWVLAVGFSAQQVNAQPSGQSFYSLEALIVDAESVVVGTMSNVVEKVITAPGGTDRNGSHHPGGKSEFALTLNVDRVLKGKAGDGLVLRFQSDSASGDAYRKFAKSETVGLWLLGPKREDQDEMVYSPLSSVATVGRAWRFLSLSASPNDFPGFYPPMFANDLSLLETKEDILARAETYAPISEMDAGESAVSTHRITIPISLGSKVAEGYSFRLTLAIDRDLEETARRMLAQPNSFVDDQMLVLDATASYYLRLGGVDLLRSFQSEENAQVIRKQLDVPLLAFEPNGFQQIRIKAFEVLLSWNLDQPIPPFADEVKSLDLQGGKISDELLNQLAKLSNLSTLKFDSSAIGDSELRALRLAGLLHRIEEATTVGDETRPKSLSDVADLILIGFPISDEGIKEIQHCPNLRSIYLSGIKTTDASLKILAKFPKLTHIFLDACSITDEGLAALSNMKGLVRLSVNNTTVTAEGVQSLQAQLPNCLITSDLDE